MLARNCTCPARCRGFGRFWASRRLCGSWPETLLWEVGIEFPRFTILALFPLIPVIPFYAELERIRETIETVAEDRIRL